MTHPISSADEERRVHAVPARRYYVVWIALLVLTAITVAVARVHLGHGLGLVVAMVIAVVKGTLVALFFMHLWDHGGANRLVLVTSLFFVGLFVGLTILDNASRFSLTNPPQQETMRWQPPGPDILSPQSGQGTTSRREGPPGEAPRQEAPREGGPRQEAPRQGGR